MSKILPVATKLYDLLSADSTIKQHYKKIEHVGIKTIGNINKANVPYIGIAWASTQEIWHAQRREQIHVFDLYLIHHLIMKQTAIVGDGLHDGMYNLIDIVTDVVRNNTFNNYLHRPIEIQNITPVRMEGDNYYLFVTILELELRTEMTTPVPS